jgi:hypothetical protein
MVEENQRSDLSKRLLALVDAKLSEEKNFFAALERATDVDRETWKHWYQKTSVVDPSTKLLTGAFYAWPQYAFWLATGIDDEKFGHIAVQENGKATNSRLGLDGPIKRVRLSTEFYLDSLRKVHTCHSDDIDHHLFMFEQAEKLRVQEVGKLCSEYSNGRQTS